MSRPTRHDEWLGATVSHDGAPLALRVRKYADTPEHRARFPRLAAVTHRLAAVRPDGLPSGTYNDSLADFDHDVITGLEAAGEGIVVLVETFAGERTYYAYVSRPGRATAEVERLRRIYPQHDVRPSGNVDPEWALYADYRARWPW